MKKELAYLAHHVFSVNRYSAEACCVVGKLSLFSNTIQYILVCKFKCIYFIYHIGNYFSLRGDHTKAAAYFQRAVKLNSNYVSALILRGHEFMEVKNARGAITSYRDAIGK